jgi:hypothetical protein
MKHFAASGLRLALIALLAAHAISAGAQTVKSSAPRPSPPRPAAEECRRVATDLLVSLAEEARGYRSAPLRARIESGVADAIWPSERERASSLFRRAWDAAREADEESERQVAEARRQRLSGRGSRLSMLPRASDLRGEVLALAARRDRALADDLLTGLGAAMVASPEGMSAASPDPVTDPMDAPAEVKQRLALAAKLLDDGDTAQALLFADPALAGPVNVFVVNFLDRLRAKNPAAADERYLTILARARQDPAADGNTVSLLSAYVFTPFAYVAFAPDGAAHSQSWHAPAVAPEILPALRSAFFKTATDVLLRPPAPPGEDRTSAGRAGLYMIIARVLPFAASFAPDAVAPLEARRLVLRADAPERARSGASAHPSAAEQSQAERARADEERLKTLAPGPERDAAAARLALSAPPAELDAARERAEGIGDSELREQLLTFLDFELAERRLRERDYDGALAVARADTLTPLQLVWFYAEAARSLGASDRARAAEFVAEAERAAERLGGGTAERAQALTAVATRACELTPARCWEAVALVVRAANSAPDYTGEGARVAGRVETASFGAVSPADSAAFNLPDLFARLGVEDLYQAIAAAKGLTNEAPRATALLSIGRSVLADRAGAGKRGEK